MRDTTAGLPGRPLRIAENAGKVRREINGDKKERGVNADSPVPEVMQYVWGRRGRGRKTRKQLRRNVKDCTEMGRGE